MIEHLDATRFANSISQDTKRKHNILIVEGTNDQLLFNKFIDENITEIKIALGFEIIIGAIQILEQRGQVDNVLGILDSDFCGLDGDYFISNHVVYTDHHDIETLALNSVALKSVYNLYGDSVKLDALEKSRSKSIKDIVFDLAKPIGFLKWANKKHKFALSFKPKKQDAPPLKFEFINSETFRFTDYRSLVTKVVNYTQNKSAINGSVDDIITKTNNIISEVDLNHLCNGHDVCNIIALSLRKHAANLGSKSPSVDEVEKTLILSFDSNCFKKTFIYAKIKDWEVRNNTSLLVF